MDGDNKERGTRFVGFCLVDVWCRSLAITSWIFTISTLMSLLCTLKKKKKEIMIKLFPSFKFLGENIIMEHIVENAFLSIDNYEMTAYDKDGHLN